MGERLRTLLLKVLDSNENKEREKWMFQDAKDEKHGGVEDSDDDPGSEDLTDKGINSFTKQQNKIVSLLLG